MVENEQKELVQIRLRTKVRVCIDYKKLNAATRKDLFMLPFIDQMVECLAGHEYYYFLDGYSGYNQIPIAAEDQEKTIVHLPVRNLRLSTHALWIVQCSHNIPTVHAQFVLRHDGMFS